ncbi:MAG: hypothetical protein JW936_01670 [Sedimentisphaerales bacterium]|nr:hypothetical protein [Sedimentisphaerales bacterium]
MIKWLWYVNAGLVLLALLTVVVGIAWLPDEPRDAVELLGRGDGGVSGVGSDSVEDGSPLVAVARSYSQRWVPPVPPSPPSFRVTQVDIPAEGDAQVWLRLPDACEPVAYNLGDTVNSYAIDEIQWQVVTVSKNDVSFPLNVPSPPAPRFGVTKTQVLEGQPSVAWLQRPDDPEAQPYEVGQVLDGYELTSVEARSAEMMLRGFRFVLNVPPPPAPTFVPAWTSVNESEPSEAWIRQNEQSQPQRHIVGDEIDGYRLDEIRPTSIVVSMIGFDFVVTVPPPPAPPFTVVATWPEQSPPQAEVLMPNTEATQNFGVGDDIEGYLVDAIGVRDITVSRIGYSFTVQVPRPADPVFALVETFVGDDANSVAWIQTEPDVPAEAYGLGATIDGFRLDAIDVTSITVNKSNYAYVVTVPQPPTPPFEVVRVDINPESNSWAWLVLEPETDPVAFTVGEQVQGYMINDIAPNVVRVNRLGYDFIMEVTAPLPMPEAPPFELVATLTFGDRKGLARLAVPDSPGAKAYAVGETVQEYRVVAVEDGLVELARDGYLFTLHMPIPEARSIEADPCDTAESAEEPASENTAPSEMVGPRPMPRPETPRSPTTNRRPGPLPAPPNQRRSR